MNATTFIHSVLSQQRYDMGPGVMWGWGHPMGWLWMIMMGLFWVALIVAVIFLVRWFSTGNRGREPLREESPLEILKKRYARGEIDKQEFEEKKKDLGY
jgi:putative membrane protein